MRMCGEKKRDAVTGKKQERKKETSTECKPAHHTYPPHRLAVCVAVCPKARALFSTVKSLEEVSTRSCLHPIIKYLLQICYKYFVSLGFFCSAAHKTHSLQTNNKTNELKPADGYVNTLLSFCAPLFPIRDSELVVNKPTS